MTICEGFTVCLEWKALLVIYRAVLQEGFRATPEQLPGEGHNPGLLIWLIPHEVSFVISSAHSAVCVGRRGSWAEGTLNIRKPKEKAKEPDMAVCPPEVCGPGMMKGDRHLWARFQGSPHVGLGQRDSTQKGGFVEQLVTAPSALRQKHSQFIHNKSAFSWFKQCLSPTIAWSWELSSVYIIDTSGPTTTLNSCADHLAARCHSRRHSRTTPTVLWLLNKNESA